MEMVAIIILGAVGVFLAGYEAGRLRYLNAKGLYTEHEARKMVDKAMGELQAADVPYDVDVLEGALKYFGGDKQIMKALEEMAELSTELHHYLEGRGGLIKVHEELADCLIILTQLRAHFGKDTVDEWINAKTFRLAQRIGVKV
jgi:hypothetical protein